MKDLIHCWFQRSFWFIVVLLCSYNFQLHTESVLDTPMSKAPRTDEQGNVIISPAVAVSDPQMASLQAGVLQLQLQVDALRRNMARAEEDIARLQSGETAQELCCTTINNKLDTLLEDSQSILDNLDVVVDVTTMESKLDACCFSMHSVLNEVLDNTESIIDNLNVVVDVTTMESKLDACCFTMNSILNEVLDNTESIIDNLNVVVDVTTLESKLDACCFTTNNKLDTLLDDVSIVESLIVEGDACDPIPLSDSMVIGNRIVLAAPGNYCLATTLGLSQAVTISLVAQDISLCLNNRTLHGVIEVYGNAAHIRNGKIAVPGSSIGIMVSPSADYAQITDINIACDSASTGTGILILSDNCCIKNGTIAAGGLGGNALAVYGSDCSLIDLAISASTQAGGHGIACYSPATCLRIKKCTIDGWDKSLTPGVGDGVFIAQGCDSIEIRDCTIARIANFAIEDNHVQQLDVSLYSSIMYNNFAYDCANGSDVYQIRNKKSMGQSYGVDLISGSPGLYSNVYIP